MVNMNIPPLVRAECEHTLKAASLHTITIPDVVSYFTTALPKLGSFYVCGFKFCFVPVAERLYEACWFG
jgi:hypothetical protein